MYRKKLFIPVCIFLLLGAAVIIFLRLNQPSQTYSLMDDPEIANLYKLSKVWGFAKYTHLSFITGEKCWDEELLNLIPLIRFVDSEDVNDILHNWFVGLGDDGFNNSGSVILLTTLENIDWNTLYEIVGRAEWITFSGYIHGPVRYVGLLVDRYRLAATDENDEYFGWLHSLKAVDYSHIITLTDMDWLEDIDFLSHFNGTSIVDRSMAPVFFDVVGRSDFSNQDPHWLMDFEDERYRLLGLFRLWNTMKYFFPYIDIIDGDWNNLLLTHISMMLEGDDRLSYELTLMSLASALNDAHIHFLVGGDNPQFTSLDTFDHKFGRYAAPVRITEAEGQLVVHVMEHEGLIPGDVVLSVNGVDINKLVADKLRYVFFPNDEKALFYIAHYHTLLRQHSSDTPMKLGILRDGFEMEIEIETIAASLARQFRFMPRPNTAYVRLENNIGLINPSMIREDSIRHIMQYFYDTCGLIIDLRQRPSFSFHHSLAEYLVEETTHFTTWIMPSQFAPGVFTNFTKDYSGGFRGVCEYAYFYQNNVVILMSERSESLTEFTVMSLRNGENVTVMGSNTIGANGDVRRLPLPGGIGMTFSSLGALTPEGGQTQRIGLSPDIYVIRTIEGIREGRDELMEAAINYLTR
ncbi:MAG: S41 family peptidase [Defluviitaleaceae bacterium]|nr:S41 family peptidase [Defluviitaleaceae bacterium]